ncbi:hypothetical protein [Daejeonia sp. YH14]|uniref:hypothetical protein n=1 Tax=Daejeonia sp. YH14 TaxID=3439042 RepID=UPI003F491F69
MHTILLQAHRGFAYLEILLVVLFAVATLLVMFGYSGKITRFLRKTTLFTMIFFHIQVLIGAVMLGTYFANGIDMGGVMKNAEQRFQFVEHPFSMLVIAVLMTMINKKIKTSEKLSMGVFIMAVVSVALFAYALPWAKLFNS